MHPTVVANVPCAIGENPLWHPGEEVLYWTDITNGHIMRYNPSTDDWDRCYDDGTVGGFTIQGDGSLLLFKESGTVTTWEQGKEKVVIDSIQGEADTRFNDVIADPQGRVFCGSMPTEDHLGRLYRLNCSGTVDHLMDGIAIPNGLGFSTDDEHLYFTESDAETIYLFDYEEKDGTIANQRTFREFNDYPGVPDGLTVDNEGYVWTAQWDGNALLRCSPSGEIVKEISFPVDKVSSVTFGGPEYTDLYVTTAGGENRPDDGELAGSLFKLESEYVGRPEYRSKIPV